MSVWLTIPSARPPEQVEPILAKWRAQGYKIALVVDDGKDAAAKSAFANVVISSPDGYRGYACSVNALIQFVMERDASAEWFVAAGDDTEPDANHTAEDIADDCAVHFSEDVHQSFALRSFGVMQPTGDRWHEGVGGFANAPIDRVAGSAWYGREYCRRMYGGRGPLFDGYKHMYVDEEAQEVAIKMGVFWQRRDLIHLHRHWGRGDSEQAVLTNPTIPAHLEKWNTSAHWQEAKALFLSRKAAGFPGHEPIL